MMHKRNPKLPYAGGLNEQEDIRLAQLMRDLDRIYTAPEPPANLTWERARMMRMQQNQVQRSGITLPLARRWQWSLRAVTAATLALLLIAGTAYAAVEVISPMLAHIIDRGPNSVTHALLQNDQFTVIGQTKTLDGVTVKLEAAYADTSQVIIGYTVVTSDSNKTALPAQEAALKTSQGLVLTPGDSGASDYNVLHSAEVATFDAGAIAGEPEQLDLHLNMAVGTLVGPRGKAQLQVNGALAFDFSVPFHRGIVLTPEQSSVVDGQKITLEKVVIAPSQTRVYISGLKDIRDEHPAVELIVPGVDGRIAASNGAPIGNGAWGFRYLQALFQKHGVWTIIVRQVSLNSSSTLRTWTFYLNVPA